MHNLDHTHKDDAKVDLLREDVHLALAHKEQFWYIRLVSQVKDSTSHPNPQLRHH